MMFRKFDSIVVLDSPRHEVNVGSVMRSALALGADAVFLIGRRYEREPGDVFHAQKHLDVIVTPSWTRTLEILGFEVPLVVVERLDAAVPLHCFAHPPRAAYVFGPEDDDVPADIIARTTHHVRIPHARPSNQHWGCLNLATSVSIVLYDRLVRPPC
jgi:tRNA(Leu) C34 or U34 (ribose-2'-O)-methylase TrmL